MPTIPSPPTDNLYEFLTVLGVTSSLAGAWLLYLSGARALDITARYHQSQNEWSVDSAYLDADLARLPTSTADTSEAIRHRLARASSLQAKLSAEAAAYRAEAPYRALYWSFIWVGGAAAIVGFVFWYMRLQRYEDQLIARRASAPERGQAQRDI